MRILYICSDFGIAPSGTKGASIHLRAITRALSDLGHEVQLLSPKKGPGEDHPVRPLLTCECALAEQTRRLLKHWLLDRGFSDSVTRELRPLIYNAWVTGPALEALGDDRPDAILERLSLFGHVGVDLAEALNAPLIVEVNAPLTEEASTFRSLQLTALAGEMERRVLARADAVLVVSTCLADRLAASGVAREKIHVIPNGVDVAKFDEAPPRDVCRAELGFDGEFVVGFAGSLKQWHGVFDLLGAFDELNGPGGSARLLIVGSGPVEACLRDEVSARNLDQAVVFTGAVDHDRVPRLLRAMDVAVAPYVDVGDFYFSPIKVFEYMASRVCVVASRLGQLADVIEDAVSGLLFRAGDVGDLTAKLRLAWSSPELRARCGLVGLETVRRRYTWTHTARSVSEVIENLVNVHGAVCVDEA